MAQQEMIFSDYLRVILKRRWTVLAITALVIVATYGWASRKPPVFESAARIKIQRLQTFTDFFNQVFVSSGDPLDNYIHEVKGDTVLSAAASKLTADGYPTDPDTLAKAVSATRIERTDLIDISAKARDADMAQRRCDAVVKVFAEIHERMITSNARDEYDYVQQSLTNTMDSLARLDAEIREKTGGMIAPDTSGEYARFLRAKLSESRVKLAVLRDQGNYTEDYPEIVALKNTISAIESQLKESAEKDLQTQTILRNQDQKKKVLEEMVSFLTKRLEEARIAQMKKSERVQEIGHAAPGAAVTTGTAYLTTIGLMLGLMLGIIVAFVAENLDTSIRTLVEIEETFHLPILGVIPHFSPHDPEVPIRPESLWDRVKYSLTVNAVTIIWRAVWSALFRRSRQFGHLTGDPTMLVVPFSPRAPATEGFRAIRTNLQIIARDSKMGSVLVTSPGPAEGKSTTISNLAFAFAQGGKKTLLVSANMRRPSLYKTFGLSRERGLSEVLTGQLTWREALKDHRDLAIGDRAADDLATAVGTENLFFITCGGRTIQPAEWLSLPVFQATVKEWEEEFDVVLVDGPPVLPVPDSVIMCAAVKRVVLVYQAGSTHRDSMLRAVSLLQKTGTTIAGLVLNDLKVSWSGSPDYFHYRGYYGRPEKQ